MIARKKDVYFYREERAFVTTENVKYRAPIKYPYMKGTFRAYDSMRLLDPSATFSGKLAERCIWREWFKRKVNRAEFTIAQHPIHMVDQSLTLFISPS